MARRRNQSPPTALGAYFDETYASDRRITAILGCVAAAERWVAFEQEWRRVLRPLGGVPFHASEWEHGKKRGEGR